MPSMRGSFTPLCSTSRAHTTAQVKGDAEDRAMGPREVTRGAISGKSLAPPHHPPGQAGAVWLIRAVLDINTCSGVHEWLDAAD